MRIPFLVGILFFSFFAVGCSLGPIETPAVERYALVAPQPSTVTAGSATKKTLLVSNITAAPGFDTNRIAYISIQYNLQYFANHQWVAPPAQMLQPIVGQLIRDKNYFHATVLAPFAGITDYRLNITLLTLQQEFTTPISRVTLLVQADLLSNTTNQIISSRYFKAVVTAPNNDPYSGVIAANRAAQIVAGQLADFVVQNCRRAS